MNQLETFEEVLQSYQPLLLNLSKRFMANGEFEESYQIAQIALHEVYQRYDPNKGFFGAYAKRFVMGRLLKEMRKEIRYYQVHHLPSQYGEEDLDWENSLENTHSPDSFTLSIEMNEYLRDLSANERKAIIHCFVLDRSIEGLARLEGVSHSTATTWKRRGLKKIKKAWLSE